jgi:hypothetical protein
VPVSANDSAKPHDVTIVQLPEGKLDMSTFSLGGLLTTTSTAGFVNVGSVEQLIDQLYIEIGGISVMPAMMMYNQVFQVHSDLQGTWNRSGLRSILQIQKTTGDAPTANLANEPFQLNQFIGFLKDVKILLTDRMPPVRIYIKWASPAVLACSAGTTAANYELSRLYATVDLLGLSPVYDQLISDKLAGGALQIPFTNYTTIPGASSDGLTTTTRWSTSADCVERVFGTFLSPTYNTANATYDATTYSSPYFTRGHGRIIDAAADFTSRWTVNGVSYPNIPMSAQRAEILLDTVQAMNEDHDLTTRQHPNINTLDNFHSNFFVHAHSFTYHDDESDNRLCGLSGLGSQLLGTFETASPLAGPVLPVVFVEHKSVLEVGANRACRYVH